MKTVFIAALLSLFIAGCSSSDDLTDGLSIAPANPTAKIKPKKRLPVVRGYTHRTMTAPEPWVTGDAPMPESTGDQQ